MPSREKQANNYVRGINIVVQFLKSFKRLPIVDTVLAVVQDFVIFASLKKILQRLDFIVMFGKVHSSPRYYRIMNKFVITKVNNLHYQTCLNG